MPENECENFHLPTFDRPVTFKRHSKLCLFGRFNFLLFPSKRLSSPNFIHSEHQ